MSPFYRRNYYNQRISPEKLAYIEKRQEIRDLENKISQLKSKFGDSFTRPEPEDFQLNAKLITEIIATDEKARKKNTSRNNFITIFAIVIFVISFFLIMSILHDIISSLVGSIMIAWLPSSLFDSFFPEKKQHDLTSKYTQYSNLLKEYPSEFEIQKIKEEEILLKERKLKIEYWLSLNGHDFETEATKLFEKSGLFYVTKTKGSGDGGVDIILRTKDGIVIFVECKAHKHAVGPHIIRGLYGAMTSQGVERGILISLGGVTDGVIDFIRNKNIAVVDINDIIGFDKWISDYSNFLNPKETNE